MTSSHTPVCSVPSVAPGGLRVSRSPDGLSMNISWSPLTLSQAKGFVDYVISYGPPGSVQRQTQSKSLTINGTFATVSSLDSTATYTVLVHGRTIAGQGPSVLVMSEPPKVPTPAGRYNHSLHAVLCLYTLSSLCPLVPPSFSYLLPLPHTYSLFPIPLPPLPIPLFPISHTGAIAAGVVVGVLVIALVAVGTIVIVCLIRWADKIREPVNLLIRGPVNMFSRGPVNLFIRGPDTIRRLTWGPDTIRRVNLLIRGPDTIRGVNLLIRGPDTIRGVNLLIRGPDTITGVNLLIRGPDTIRGVNLLIRGPDTIRGVNLLIRGPVKGLSIKYVTCKGEGGLSQHDDAYNKYTISMG